MLFLKLSYTKSLPRAQAHVNYIAFRSRELESRGGPSYGVFDAERDAAQVSEFRKALEDPFLAHPRVAKVHKLIVSFDRDEFDRRGLQTWREVTREALALYQARTGRTLIWVAAEHNSARHPHVHVAIKSAYVGPDGQKHRLKLTQEDRVLLGECFARAVERCQTRSRDPVAVFDRNLEQRERELTMLSARAWRLSHYLALGLGELLRLPRAPEKREVEREDEAEWLRRLLGRRREREKEAER